MTNADAVLPATELEALAARALAAGGMRPDDAAEAARMLVLADLFGIRAHGVQRIPEYLGRMRAGGIDPLARPRIERVAGALMRVDGSNGIGPLVASRALHAAMQAAHGAGIAAAFVRGSNHPGAVMPYCFIAARHGFASIIGSNAGPAIAPVGGCGARFGGNPLGIGVPRPGGDPVILDMAMSATAGAPAGPSATDRAAAAAGLLLAMGGHSGHGLALMVDMLAGVLSGAGCPAPGETPGTPQDLGHVLILIDTTRLGLAETLAARIDDFRAALPADPTADARLPGEAALARHRRHLEHGVPVAAEDLALLRGLAG
ncbi:MAG TPA: Ldh family oxidoreductase [Roseomonas sp.]|nr:Ldh family oxidoreductase [Roseomonas sp.]